MYMYGVFRCHRCSHRQQLLVSRVSAGTAHHQLAPFTHELAVAYTLSFPPPPNLFIVDYVVTTTLGDTIRQRDDRIRSFGVCFTVYFTCTAVLSCVWF